MLDFKNPDLYANKDREFNRFVDDVLKTRTQIAEEALMERGADTSDSSILDAYDDLKEELGTDNIEDTLEKMQEPQSTDVGYGQNAVEEPSLFIEDTKLGTPYELGDTWKNLAVAPYYLFYYIFRSIGNRLGEKDMLEKYMKSLLNVSGMTSLITLFLLFFTDAKFIFSLPIQAVVSVSLFVISFFTLMVLKDPDRVNIRFVSDDDLVEEDIEGSEDDDDEFDDDAVELLREAMTSEHGELDHLDTLDDLVYEPEVPVIPESLLLKKEPVLNNSIIPHSTIDVNHVGEDFLKDLQEVYDRNAKYEGQGHVIQTRKELVTSLADYLVANDKSFGSWNTLEESGVEYNNIMYTLYLALGDIASSYLRQDETNFFRVIDAKENPLMYKLEIEIPRNLFKLSNLTNAAGDSMIKSRLRKSDDDLDVRCIISSYQDGFVIKLFKNAKGFVSLGDIVRYHDEDSTEKQAYEDFLGDKMGLPMILGLRNNEYPTVVDLSENTSVVIAGESGSGKSWGTFLVMINMLLTNSYHDLNIVVMDKKKSVFWREFARSPHVVGYHTNVPDYFDILKELKAEMEHRKEVLQQMNQEDWKGLRKYLRNQKKEEALKAFPWLIIIMDEISNTMKEVLSIAGEDNKHIYDSFIADMAQIAQEGRSLGMKLVLIGQRTIANSMPKDVMSNASMKFGFKLSAPDMERLLGESKEVKNRLPTQPGEAYLNDFMHGTPMFLRTLTVGGIENDQITNLIRMLAFEWTRRSKGDKLLRPHTLSFTYNRDSIREKVFADMEKGNLFLGAENDDAVDEVINALLNNQGLKKSRKSDLLDIEITKEDRFGNFVDKKEVENTTRVVPRDNVVQVSTSPASISLNKTEVTSEVRTDDTPKEVANSWDFDIDSMDVLPDDEVISKETIEVNSPSIRISGRRDPEEATIGDGNVSNNDDVGEDVTDNGSELSKDPKITIDVRGNVLDKVELMNEEHFKWDNVKPPSGTGRRKMMGSAVKKTGGVANNPIDARNKVMEDLKKREALIEKDENAPLTIYPRNGMSIVQYIKMYGEGSGTKKLPVEVVSKVFSKEEINRAIGLLNIVRDGDTYQI